MTADVLEKREEEAPRPAPPPWERVIGARDLKTLMTTTVGFPPATARIGRPPRSIAEPVFLSDLLPTIEPGGPAGAVRFMRETTATNASAALPEGAAKPESTIIATEIVLPLYKVATVLSVTEEVMNDDAMADAYLNARLPLLVKETLDTQLVQGSGTAPNLTGFLHQTPPIPNVAGPGLDAILQAIANVRINGKVQPDAILVHPTNWLALLTAKLAGGSYAGQILTFDPPAIEGVPVYVTTSLPVGTALCGAFQSMSALATKGGFTTERSNSHLDYFGSDLLMLRGEIRAQLIVYRLTAFCSVSALA